MYTLYILQCADNTLYTGITTDITRRLQEHNASGKGAAYTSGRRPVQLVYQTAYANRSAAQKAEAAIKKLSRQKKLALIAENFL